MRAVALGASEASEVELGAAAAAAARREHSSDEEEAEVEDPEAQTLPPPVFQRCAGGGVSVVTPADLGLPHAAAPPARLVFTALRRTTAVLELT